MTNNKHINTRIDKWLWAARFYKTRQLAVKAIKNGQIYLNGQRIKPAANIQQNDTLLIKKGPYEVEIDILNISEQRGSATIAQTLYQETEQSIIKRQKLKGQLAAQPKIINEKRKPDKRGVRDSLKFKRGE